MPDVIRADFSGRQFIRPLILSEQRTLFEMKTHLQIEGMHCDACVGFVSQALQNVEGVERALVDLNSETAEVEGEGYTITGLLEAVEDEGYAAKVAD